MLPFVHYSDVTWAIYAVSIHWQLDSLYNSSFGLMSKETSMVQYGEEFFFTDSCLLLVSVLPIIPHTHHTPPIPPYTPPPYNFEIWTAIHGLYHFSLMKGNTKGTHYCHAWVDSTDGFLLQRASNAESASISWCHHERCLMIMITTLYWALLFLLPWFQWLLNFVDLYIYIEYSWIISVHYKFMLSSVVTWSALQWTRNIIAWYSGKLIIWILSWP